MNDKLKKYNYFRILTIVVFIVLGIIFGFFVFVDYFGKDVFELEFIQYFIKLLVFLLIYLITYGLLNFLSVIWHELGHLIFGLKAKMKFISFNVLGFTFIFDNNKIKVTKEAKIPGILGYCNMATDSKKKYNKNEIKLFYMGGVIFHIIAVIVTVTIVVFIHNKYLKYIGILNIIINMYLALYNLIPSINKSGTNTDALHLKYYYDDEEYINTVSRFQQLQILIAKGCNLKDIDESYFTMPKKIKTNTDLLNAMIYTDYLSSNEQYKESFEYTKKILDEAKTILTKQDVITLKIQLINNIFYCGDDLEQIKNIWDDDIKRYLDLMGDVLPICIGINYLYATLIEKNEINSKRYLKQFQQLNRKRYDKYMIEDVDKIIEDVNKRQ